MLCVQLSDGALGVSRWERLNRRERTRQLLAGGVVLSDRVPAAAAATPFSRCGGEESIRAFPARPPERPPDHPYDAVGWETYYTRFRGSLRRHCHTSRPRYGGRPPTPMRETVALAALSPAGCFG